jgi:2-dehydropantoate 2-reductase
MKVCIIGAGAIGGFIGTRLALAGQAELSAIARGATLAALRRHGWRLHSGGVLHQAPAHVTDQPAELGVQDLLIIAVKAPALTDVARQIGPLLGPETLVLPAMNGVPWWFCKRVAGFEGKSLGSVDPGGVIDRAIPFEQVVGCVVHAATAAPEPGLVRHTMGQGLVVGEPAGGKSQRVQRIADLLANAGFDVTHSDDLRHAIWFKLLGNLTMNPVTAITGATMDRVLADPLVRDFCSAVMLEAGIIGDRIGCHVDSTPEQRHAVTSRLGAFKSSMLQDVEAGRPIELDAIVTAVHEIGRHLGLQTPQLDALLGLARLFGRVHGLYPEATR